MTQAPDDVTSAILPWQRAFMARHAAVISRLASCDETSAEMTAPASPCSRRRVLLLRRR